jgi:hypothetical protein
MMVPYSPHINILMRGLLERISIVMLIGEVLPAIYLHKNHGNPHCYNKTVMILEWLLAVALSMKLISLARNRCAVERGEK